MTPRSEEVAETKIDNLDVACLADKNVFDLEISVYDAVPVQVVQSTCDLPAKFPGLFLLKFAVRDDVIEHLATVDIFEKHIPMVVCTDNIVKSTDVGMVQEGADGGFTSGSDFLGLIGTLFVGARLVIIVGRTTRNNFTCYLVRSKWLVLHLRASCLSRWGHEGQINAHSRRAK